MMKPITLFIILLIIIISSFVFKKYYILEPFENLKTSSRNGVIGTTIANSTLKWIRVASVQIDNLFETKSLELEVFPKSPLNGIKNGRYSIEVHLQNIDKEGIAPAIYWRNHYGENKLLKDAKVIASNLHPDKEFPKQYDLWIQIGENNVIDLPISWNLYGISSADKIIDTNTDAVDYLPSVDSKQIYDITKIMTDNDSIRKRDSTMDKLTIIDKEPSIILLSQDTQGKPNQWNIKSNNDGNVSFNLNNNKDNSLTLKQNTIHAPSIETNNIQLDNIQMNNKGISSKENILFDGKDVQVSNQLTIGNKWSILPKGDNTLCFNFDKSPVMCLNPNENADRLSVYKNMDGKPPVFSYGKSGFGENK